MSLPVIQPTATAPAREPQDILSVIHDVVSKLGRRNNLQVADAGPEAMLSLAEFYRLGDAEAVFLAYTTIFGCVPDLDGFRHYVSTLRRGAMSRRQFLETMRNAPQAQARRLRILQDATEHEMAAGGPRQEELPRTFHTAADFSADNVDQFLTHAYTVILKRAPDPTGMDSYREAMANGATPAQVLASLLTSDEHKTRRQPVVIFGITPVDEVFKALFDTIEGMSSTIINLEHQLLAIKNG
ncbi:DUF4214 domain-containing protein [Azospirillum argentinense]